MDRTRIGRLSLVVLAGLLTVCRSAFAVVLEPIASGGLAYTDNAALTPNHASSDWIAIGRIGARFVKDDGPLTAGAEAGVTYQNYLEGTFDNQRYFGLAATSKWEMIRGLIDWQSQDYFSQTSINTLDASTPSNIENTNVFSFGPNINVPLSARQQLKVSPLFQDYYYEKSDTDNRQFGLRANWLYKLHQTVAAGLDGKVTEVKYDNQNKNPDYTIRLLQGTIEETRLHSMYKLNLGGTVITRDRVSDQKGPTGSLTWTYNYTDRSSAIAYFASELTDSSYEYYTSQVNPGTGNFSNVQTTGDILRSNIARLTLERHSSTVSANVVGEYRDENYKVTPYDRKVVEISGGFNYQAAPLVTTGIYGGYNRTNATDQNQRDASYLVGGDVDYRLSRKLHAIFDLRYRNEKSNVASAEYSEFGAVALLVYGYDVYDSYGHQTKSTSVREAVGLLFPNYYSNYR